MGHAGRWLFALVVIGSVASCSISFGGVDTEAEPRPARTAVPSGPGLDEAPGLIKWETGRRYVYERTMETKGATGPDLPAEGVDGHSVDRLTIVITHIASDGTVYADTTMEPISLELERETLEVDAPSTDSIRILPNGALLADRTGMGIPGPLTSQGILSGGDSVPWLPANITEADIREGGTHTYSADLQELPEDYQMQGAVDGEITTKEEGTSVQVLMIIGASTARIPREDGSVLVMETEPWTTSSEASISASGDLIRMETSTQQPATLSMHLEEADGGTSESRISSADSISAVVELQA